MDGFEGMNQKLNEPFDLMLPSRVDLKFVVAYVKEIYFSGNCIGKKEDNDKIRGLGLGADDDMTKPFSPSKLVARVQAHIKRYQQLTVSGQPQETLEIEIIVVDKAARKVFVLGQEVIFTMTKFDLLEFLWSIRIVYGQRVCG